MRSGRAESVSPEFELLSLGLGTVVKKISVTFATKVSVKALTPKAFYLAAREALGIAKTGIVRQNWNGFANIFKANADEIAEATTKIKQHRIIQGSGTQGNYGYLEGKIGNITKNGEMVRSGAPDDIVEIFDAVPVNSKNVAYGDNAWMRTTDSEYKMLNRLVNDLKSTKGKIYPDISGELKIVSEREYCPSCQGVIQQFNEMFPNVKLILVDGAK